jgi:ATP-binding cassette subfamily B protein
VNARDQIPGIALTGYSQAGDRVRARQAGFVVHLTKPVAAPVLIEAILDVTGKARIGR